MFVKPPICHECFGQTWGTQFFDATEKRVHLERLECMACKRHATHLWNGDRHHYRGIFVAHKYARTHIRSRDEEEVIQILLQPNSNLSLFATQHTELVLYRLVASEGTFRWEEIITDPPSNATSDSVREGFFVKERAC